MGQIALPLAKGDAHPESIVVGSANQAAVEALAQPDGWPYRTAILTGPSRSGKSLLARWFAANGGDVIDDADHLAEDVLFHRWNRTQQDGVPLLLTTRDESWQVALPDLRSRLGAALHLSISVPDDEMVGALIEAHAAHRGLALGDGARAYLTPRAERGFSAIESLVAAIDRISLERKVPATMSVWRDALEAVQGPAQPKLL
ncbi:ATPase [Altererythrobacter aquiaggeris]|uniref:ATPase n=1 Tax=Aestuarierythrobacter aquiaggeris TaxID=1898396 RepID=UPI003016AE47